MDINEIREKKELAEASIAGAIRKFTQETGLEVSDVKAHFVDARYSGGQYSLIDLKIEVKLP